MAFKDKEKELSYIAKYQKDNYDRITVMAQKGKKEEYKRAAQVKDMTLSQFMVHCAEKELDSMKK